LLLSGGVDSSVALNLLLRDNETKYNVTAFYLKIWLEDELAHLGECPWEDDYRQCLAVSQQLGVPLETVSLHQEQKAKVISYTVREAETGRTPNPDILCNNRIKFGCFYDAVAARYFDFVATGHYAQLKRDNNGRVRLLRAPDAVKDQSYFCAR
jgi:tRNA U34 2-thiouridine synthase MnmA/TrmU